MPLVAGRQERHWCGIGFNHNVDVGRFLGPREIHVLDFCRLSWYAVLAHCVLDGRDEFGPFDRHVADCLTEAPCP